MKELGRIYKIVRFYSLFLIIGYFLTHCQVFLNNSHYALRIRFQVLCAWHFATIFRSRKAAPAGIFFQNEN